MRTLFGTLRIPKSRVIGSLVSRLHFPHRCDLWRKCPVTTGVDKELRDTSLYELVDAGVWCLFDAQPETNETTVMGRTKSDNLFTMDVFLFPEGVELLDTYVIVFRTPGENADKTFVIQGNPQAGNRHPFHPVTTQRVLAVA
ncbi:MAG: hypothetical protein H8F28_19850, partial [Fibrella sp.]|nr:hypothetical protein [Armatimonadota bacterium]